MRLLAGLPLLRPATPPPPPSLWTVWSTSHHAALVRVADTLRTLVASLTRGAPDEDAVRRLGDALDAAAAVNGPGGVPCHLDEREARRLIEASDLGKTLLQQLRAMLLAPKQNRDRDLWERRLAATLVELARVLPLTP